MKNSSPNKSEVSTTKTMKGSGEGGDQGGEILEALSVEEQIPEEDWWHLQQREITSETQWTGEEKTLSGDNSKSIRYRVERIFAISVATLCFCLLVAIIIVIIGVVVGIAALLKGFATGEIPMH